VSDRTTCRAAVAAADMFGSLAGDTEITFR
jgi:hypothetical protein